MMLNDEVLIKADAIGKIVGQNTELHALITESMLKLKDDEIGARRSEAEAAALKDSIQTVLKEKEDVVFELE